MVAAQWYPGRQVKGARLQTASPKAEKVGGLVYSHFIGGVKKFEVKEVGKAVLPAHDGLTPVLQRLRSRNSP